MNEKEQPNTPPAGGQQDSERATSGGGLGQGRETAGGWQEDTDIVGRPGKGMGGTDDTGGSEQPTTPEEGDEQPEQERSDNDGPMLPLDTKDQGLESA